jgi:hypothetical protein
MQVSSYLNYNAAQQQGKLITNDEVVRREQLKCNESIRAAAAADSTNAWFNNSVVVLVIDVVFNKVSNNHYKKKKLYLIRRTSTSWASYLVAAFE